MATLAELRAQVAEIEAQRADDAAVANEASERRTLECELELAKLSDLGVRGKDYGVIVVSRTGDLVAVRVPKPVVWKRYVDRTRAEKDDLDAVMADFVKASLAFPAKAELERLIELEPALLVRAALACSALAGLRETASVGKA